MAKVHEEMARVTSPTPVVKEGGDAAPLPPSGVVKRPTGGISRGWLIALVASLVLGLAGVGTAVGALVTMPSKTSGPQGPQGVRGARGPIGATGARGVPGPVGATGAKGATGPRGAAGPAGTIKATSVVHPTALVSAANPGVGTVLVAKISCPSHDVLLNGGAQLSAPGVGDQHIGIGSSFPLNSSTWEVVGRVNAPLEPGTHMTMKPFALCGIP